jgi:transcriptional regulator with XRE-family HTH domain
VATFKDVIWHIKPSALVENTGRSSTTVSNWRAGRSLPESSDLPAIADLLRMDLGELCRIVAAESRVKR